MRTVVHLSDLHFGRADPALLEPLAAQVNEMRPHVVVVSGEHQDQNPGRSPGELTNEPDSIQPGQLKVDDRDRERHLA